MAIYYTSHYIAYAEMLGKPNVHSTFEYLLDEYAQQEPADRIIQVSAADIAKKRSINKRTVQSTIELLEGADLIKCVKSSNGRMAKCEINIARYVSLINAFMALSDDKDKLDFTEAMYQNDDEKLKKLGYFDQEDAEEFLKKTRGRKLPILEIYKENYQKQPFYDERCKNAPFEENAESKGAKMHVSNQKVQKCTFGDERCKNARFEENYEAKGAKMHVSEFGKVHFWQFLLKNGEEIAGRDEVKKLILDANVHFCTFYKDQIDFDVLFDDPESFFAQYPELKWCIFAPLMVHFCTFDGAFLHLSGGQYIYNTNKKNNNNNLGREFFDKGQDNKNSGLESNKIFPVLNSKNNGACLESEEEQNSEENFSVNFDFVDKVISSHKKNKRKERLPFIPVDEAAIYISDISACLDRADKIFINQIWAILEELVCEQSVDENGDGVEKAISPEGYPFPVDRLHVDLLSPAYEATQEIIQQGKVTVNGEELPVTATMLSPEEVSDILDWEVKDLSDRRVYEITSSLFRNIYAEEVEEVKEKTGREAISEGRDDDRLYMQKIILIGDDDERYKSLTPIELVAYNFLNDHFQVNDNGEIGEPKTHFINRTTLGQLYFDLREKGMKDKDFLSVLFKNRPERGSGCLVLKPRMFSADKIRRWNDLQGHRSIIDSETI